MKESILRAFGTVLDGVGIGMCVFDTEDRVLAWNESFLDLFPEHRGAVHAGEPYAENLRRFYGVRLRGNERDAIERYVAEGVKRHRTQRRPYEFDHRGFRVRVSSIEARGVGRLRVWRKVLDTVPATAKPSQQWASTAPDASKILERMPDGLLIVDPSDQALWANDAFMRLYGLARWSEVQGLPFEAIYRHAWHGDAGAGKLEASIEMLREHQRFLGAPYELALPGNHWVRIIEQRPPEIDGHGYLVHVDITLLKRQQQALQAVQRRLEALATVDELTGLANRKRFDEALDVEFRRAQREGSELSLLAIDVDDFRSITGTLGPPVGDDVLRRIGRLMAGAAGRAGDLAARHGDDRFALLLPGTDVAQAEAIAQELRRAVAVLDLRHLGVAALTASVGLCSSASVRHADSAAALAQRADDALAAAKRSGKNAVHVADDTAGHAAGDRAADAAGDAASDAAGGAATRYRGASKR